jgi:hypothetical protein
VRTDSVSHTVNIHIPYPDTLMRVTAKGRGQGGRGKPGLRIQR